MPPALNFGGLDEEHSDYGNSAVVVLPIPYEGTVSYGRGAARGPEALLAASMHMELYDEELKQDTYLIGIHTLDPVAAADLPGKMMENIREAAAEPLRDGKFLASIGGEHSVTKGLLDAFCEVRGKDFGVLQIDAHADLRDSYDGTPYSHACVMRRVVDMGLHSCQVGIRSLSREEADFIDVEGLDVIFAHDMAVDEEWMDRAVNSLPEKVYLTIDLDCLDPSVMPATGTPEPGGLDWHSLTALLRRVSEEREVIGLDVVELAPIPRLHAPDFLAAKLLYRTLGYIFSGNGGAS